MGLITQISEFVLVGGLCPVGDPASGGPAYPARRERCPAANSPTPASSSESRNLRADELPPDLLTLEVTETEVMADLTQATRVLDELAALGIRIAIDDYGTGYSSLAYLHRLPVQELKIDRSFVTNLPNEIEQPIIVRSSIAMAHSLGLRVVAEGAEDEVTCAMLADAGCDLHPGLLPLEAHDVVPPSALAPARCSAGVRTHGHSDPRVGGHSTGARRARVRATGAATNTQAALGQSGYPGAHDNAHMAQTGAASAKTATAPRSLRAALGTALVHPRFQITSL